MSGRVCRDDNRTTDNGLPYAIQSACDIALGGNNELMHEESNQRNEHEQSVESSQSNSASDAGSSATTTRTPSTRSAEHTSFPCAHCRDNDSSTGLVRKYKYTVHPTIADHVERDYADYINATSAQGQGASTGVRGSDESRNFKQADADSGDTVERRIGIPAGVTI
jgi:hypothetical protein